MPRLPPQLWAESLRPNLPLGACLLLGRRPEDGDPRARTSATGNGHARARRAGCPGVNVESGCFAVCRGRRQTEATEIAVTESVLAIGACRAFRHQQPALARPAQRIARSSLADGYRGGGADRGTSRDGANGNASDGREQSAADPRISAAQASKTTAASAAARACLAGSRACGDGRGAGCNRGQRRGAGNGGRGRGAGHAAQRQRHRDERHAARAAGA